MEKLKPRIAISMGDPNGVGPEVTLKSLRDSRLMKYVDPVIIGSASVMRTHLEKLEMQDVSLKVYQDIGQLPERGIEGSVQAEKNELAVLDLFNGAAAGVKFGEITEEAGALSMKAVEKAVDLCVNKQVDAMVTAPISKEAIALAGYENRGHTGFIAERIQAKSHTMVMVSQELKVGLLSEHVPIGEVSQMVTKEAILEKVNILSASLMTDFAVDRPRIAVLGLNPHAGDGGLLGKEEMETIQPAIDACCEQGHLVFGPFAADGFFAVGGFKNYDAILAMYHDQGLIPFKTIAFGHGVNYTAGLDIVRTSPDHGTAFNIAGQRKASPDSMRSAIYLARDIVKQRKAI